MRQTCRFVFCLVVCGWLGVAADQRSAEAQVLAEQPTEFSGTQGTNRWFYGYFDRSVDLANGGDGIYDNTKFKRFVGGESSTKPLGPENQWYFNYWVYGPCFPCAEINAESMFPNQAASEQFPVLRWEAEADGVFKVTGFFQRVGAPASDGTIGKIFHNGVEIFSELTLNEIAEIDLQIPKVSRNDEIDFLVDFGIAHNGNDKNDETKYFFTIEKIGDVVEVPGDFNGDGVLDAADIDDLTAKVAAGSTDLSYDVNSSSSVNADDVTFWIKDLYKTWIGDANLDKQFNSGDLVDVLATGTYEADVASVWTTGDFNGDGRTNSGDLVSALADGGYEAGPKAAVSAVPEPSSLVLALMGLLPLWRRRRA